VEADQPADLLRRRLQQQLARAQRALTDERQETGDVLALVRNVAAAVLADAELLASAPQLG
jgi:hypothetical protein